MRLLFAPVELLAFAELVAGPLLDTYGEGVMAIFTVNAVALQVYLKWPGGGMHVNVRATFNGVTVTTDAHFFGDPFLEVDMYDPDSVEMVLAAVEEVRAMGSRDAVFAHRDARHKV